ncbi:SagB/ThcOx family dehydrogenase [Clostridium sp. N3C]|uniref:SagB/ThcOx family dehydrogenase n=1 Tax=Clostridium sp. N3C TaxID=1776758 RepID=UPI0009422428|nr:SagB/ThcOx family dehydrogenase [Clostridium sp. N3C]
MNRFSAHRPFLKANHNVLRQIITDRQNKMPQPSMSKTYIEDEKVIDLPQMRREVITKYDLYDCINDRRSVRVYSGEYITLDELSYMLWATQGIKCIIGDDIGTLKNDSNNDTVYSFETYLLINRVEGLEKGVYKYLPLRHSLYLIYPLDNIESVIDQATPDKPYIPHFADKAAIFFAWTYISYRSEYKYDIIAHKNLPFDVGHICQNLYIAGESVNCGTCVIGNYNQQYINKVLQLDGEEEFVIYLAAVGKKPKDNNSNY